MTERKSKGTVLNVMQSFVVSRFGAAQWRRVLDHMPAAERMHAESAVAIGWYPTSVFMQGLLAIDAVCGQGNPAFIAEFGRAGAEQDLTVFHRMFLRMANPAYAAEKVGDYWSRFHTHGKWVSRRVDHGYIATLSDFEGHAIYCAMLVPYIHRMLELVGAKQVQVTHPECIHRGAKVCVFTSRWQ